MTLNRNVAEYARSGFWGFVSEVCDEFHSGPNFGTMSVAVSLPDRDVKIVPEYSEHAPNIVGGIVKVK